MSAPPIIAPDGPPISHHDQATKHDDTGKLREVPRLHEAPKHGSGNLEMLVGFGLTVLFFAIIFGALIAFGVVKLNKGEASATKTPVTQAAPATK